MCLLIFSDSHGGTAALDRIIRREKEATHIFFLGDTLSDIEDLEFEYSDKIFHTVPGNCDFFSRSRATDLTKVENKNIYFTHGHLHNVNCGTEKLLEAAQNCGADIALFGHTHIPLISYENGVYIVNPGSVTRSREGANSYAVIDITKSGILPAIKKV